MRVTGGRLGGRRLRAPRGDRVRPTADRVRESLFARLESLGGLAGARVLDAFAGTGALGIEALSRGAEVAVFVERSAPVRTVLEHNLATLGLGEGSRVVRGDARSALRRLARSGERFDLVFLDPPYEAGLLPEILPLARSVLDEAGEVWVETARQDPLPSPPGLVILDARRYGDTVITRFGVDGAEGGAGSPAGSRGQGGENARWP